MAEAAAAEKKDDTINIAFSTFLFCAIEDIEGKPMEKLHDS